MDTEGEGERERKKLITKNFSFNVVLCEIGKYYSIFGETDFINRQC